MTNDRKMPRLQGGFSMVEMLMAAFIMAVGLLGLSMLQVMSIRAAGGSQSLTTAVQVAEQVIDRVEMEGRLSWANITSSTALTPVAISSLTYLKSSDDGYPTTINYFNLFGEEVADTSSEKLYTVTTNIADAPIAGVTGKVSDVTVQVDFADLSANSAKRTVLITRRVIHG